MTIIAQPLLDPTPIGLYNFGIGYLDTARAAEASGIKIPFGDPKEFLVAHSLELIFKADLRRSLTMDQIKRDYGHNLSKLRKRVSKEFAGHFHLDTEFDNLVLYLSEGHSGPNWRNRYLVTGYRAAILPAPELIRIMGRFTTNDRKWLLAHFITSA